MKISQGSPSYRSISGNAPSTCIMTRCTCIMTWCTCTVMHCTWACNEGVNTWRSPEHLNPHKIYNVLDYPLSCFTMFVVTDRTCAMQLEVLTVKMTAMCSLWYKVCIYCTRILLIEDIVNRIRGLRKYDGNWSTVVMHRNLVSWPSSQKYHTTKFVAKHCLQRM